MVPRAQAEVECGILSKCKISHNSHRCNLSNLAPVVKKREYLMHCISFGAINVNEEKPVKQQKCSM